MGFLCNSLTRKVAVLQSTDNLCYRSSFFIQCWHLMSRNYNTASSFDQIWTPARTLWKNKHWASVIQKSIPDFLWVDSWKLWNNLKRKLWNKEKLLQSRHQQIFALYFSFKFCIFVLYFLVSIKVSSWHWSRQISKFYLLLGAHIHLRQSNV